MRRWLLPILLFGVCLLVFATQKVALFHNKYVPKERVVYYQLGNLNIPLRIQQFGKVDDLVYISLHDDEFTAVESTRQLLERHGGILIEIENNEKRNIRFRLGNGVYGIDPNRMFSQKGIAKSMDELGRVSTPAVREIEKFADRVLQLIPEDAECIIALHNNTDGQFSATSYAKGNKRQNEAEAVHINSEHDADDFFLTTDRKIFNALAAQNYNAVLQDNSSSVDDGSLSVYCGKNGLKYVNLETEHNKRDLYYSMMEELIQILKEPRRSR